jgi:hypothetical protein
MQISSGLFNFIALDHQVCVNQYGLQVFHGKFRGYRSHAAKTVDLAHHFIENGGDNSAVDEAGAALIFRAKPESSANAPGGVVLLKRKVHSAGVRGAAAEANISRIGLKKHID